MKRTRNRALYVLLPCLLVGLAGRASAEDSFAIAVAPDLQQEVLDAKDTRLANRFQWLVDNRQALNLKCVLQVGDFMNWDTPDHIQYERASAAVKILDEAGLPFVFTIGNHDTQATGGTPEKPGGSARPGNTHDNQRPGGPGRLPARGSHRPERAQLTHSVPQVTPSLRQRHDAAANP